MWLMTFFFAVVVVSIGKTSFQGKYTIVKSVISLGDSIFV